MAQHDRDTAEAGTSVMDYAEHERTYGMFLTGSKWLTIITCALLIGMAFGFFAGGGFLGGLIVFLAVNIAAYFIA